jgi:hypothetical protein
MIIIIIIIIKIKIIIREIVNLIIDYSRVIEIVILQGVEIA